MESESFAPGVGPEQPPLSPEREAFHQLVRDIFELTEPALREDARDRLETTATLGERTARAWQDFSQTPWNIPKHVRQFDTAFRGRDLGSMQMRLGRIVLYNAVRGITTSLDLVDDIAKIPLQKIPGGGFVSAGVEFLSDELINAGTEWTLRKATGDRHARFASPLAVAANRLLNIVPFLGLGTNAPGIEARIRNAYNLPIVGVPVEQLYKAVNRLLIKIEQDPKGRWLEQFIFAVLGRGISQEEAFKKAKAAGSAAGAKP